MGLLLPCRHVATACIDMHVWNSYNIISLLISHVTIVQLLCPLYCNLSMNKWFMSCFLMLHTTCTCSVHGKNI